MSQGWVQLVPLSDKVIFPGQKLTLQLQGPGNQDSTDQKDRLKLLGLISYSNLQKQELCQYGTIAGVISSNPVSKSPNKLTNFKSQLIASRQNEWIYNVVGLERFKLLDTKENYGTQCGQVEIVKDQNQTVNDAMIKELKEQAFEFLVNSQNVQIALREQVLIRKLGNMKTQSDVSNVGFELVVNLPMSLGVKQKILENFDLQNRTQEILSILKKCNGQKVFSNRFNNQMMAKLETEQKKNNSLRDLIPRANPLSTLQQKLDNLSLSPDIKEQIQNDFLRLRGMEPNHSEYQVLKSYLDLVSSLPWDQQTEDNINLSKAQKVLDKNHFGMEKVKSRIIEHLAIRKLRGDMKGSILCFQGPPGVGKTSLGKSIAKSMGRKFQKLALGGVKDEAEIRGHRRTYLGAIPGSIINCLNKAKSNNPVLLLDEIDKLGGYRQRGDPASALLEVLDPEQNHSFTDHYMAIPFDLSNIMFLATANTLETIPAPLLDRMEVIQLSGYSSQDKVKICKKYLLPKQIKENGLKVNNVTFEDNQFLQIIESYTRESGVRQITRCLGSICRKIAIMFSESNQTEEDYNINVSDELIVECLGNPIYNLEQENKVNSPGIALGLAWTPVGGETLLIETSQSQGSGQIRMTGNLGNVMKESIITGLSWIRANFQHILPNPKKTDDIEGLDQMNIHIHFPSAAIPKDGPSAGVTILTALVSLLIGVKVQDNVAMTGEVSLRGNVLPVGGIREKVLAAQRAGVKKVILPIGNRLDLKEVPEAILREVQIVFASHILEVLIYSLEDVERFESILKTSGIEIYSKL